MIFMWLMMSKDEPVIDEQGNVLGNHMEFQITDATDMGNIPEIAESAVPGSLAWLGNFSKIWNKNNDGEWVLIHSEDVPTPEPEEPEEPVVL